MGKKEQRQYKRFEPKERIRGIVFPILTENMTTHMVDVDVLNYSDGGVLVRKLHGKFRPLLNQDVYFLLMLDDEAIFTLKGKTVRVDDKATFAVQFNEAVDSIGHFPSEDILSMRDRLMTKLNTIL